MVWPGCTLVVVAKPWTCPQELGAYHRFIGVPGCEFSQTIALDPGPQGPVVAPTRRGRHREHDRRRAPPDAAFSGQSNRSLRVVLCRRTSLSTAKPPGSVLAGLSKSPRPRRPTTKAPGGGHARTRRGFDDRASRRVETRASPAPRVKIASKSGPLGARPEALLRFLHLQFNGRRWVRVANRAHSSLYILMVQLSVAPELDFSARGHVRSDGFPLPPPAIPIPVRPVDSARIPILGGEHICR